MNQKELTKKVMMILYWKNPFGLKVFIKKIQPFNETYLRWL